MSSMDMSGTTAASNANTSTTSNASVVEVPIQNFAFNPTTLTIKVGTTVKWTNMDSATHTVTSGANRTADKKFDQSLPQGQTFQYTFTAAGEYDYFCKPHANMNAKIIVQ
jgi:plastocyanin